MSVSQLATTASNSIFVLLLCCVTFPGRPAVPLCRPQVLRSYRSGAPVSADLSCLLPRGTTQGLPRRNALRQFNIICVKQ